MALRPQGLLCVCAVTADHIKNVCWVGPLCLCAGQKDVTGTWVTSHINSELNILHFHLCLLFTHYKLLGCSIIYGYLHVGNSVANMIGNVMEKKIKNQPPKQMYRILNRAMERPKMDWKTLHVWFVNMIYTSVSLNSLLLAAPGRGGARGAVTQCPVQAAVSPGDVSSARPDLSGSGWLQLTTMALLLQFSHCPLKAVTEEGLMERGRSVIHCVCPGKRKAQKKV